MNIIEAVKSGKPFRRKDWDKTVRTFPNNEDRAMMYQIGKHDILADDWEIKEEKIELTKDQIKKALMDNVRHKQDLADLTVIIALDKIFKQLGFTVEE